MIKRILPANTCQVKSLLDNGLFEQLHSKQRHSLSDAVLGLLTSQNLQPSKIGDGLAAAKGLLPKHTKKQVARLLSNDRIDVDYCQEQLTQYLTKHRGRIIVATDRTVFAKDLQLTLTIRLITNHGRATPLLWKTVSAVGLKGHKSRHVLELFKKLRTLVSNTCQVIVLADREFGTIKNMRYLKEVLGFDYILRIKRNFTIIDKQLKRRLAHEWLQEKIALDIHQPKITVQAYQVARVVIAKEPEMKELWVLACSLKNISTKTILKYYGKRWSTETSYRDEKDLQFGFGLKKSRSRCCEKRDRLLIISAIAIIFLTLLGAASEIVGFDKYLKANTLKRRTHALVTQGRMLLILWPTLKERWRDDIVRQMCQVKSELESVTCEQFFV